LHHTSSDWLAFGFLPKTGLGIGLGCKKNTKRIVKREEDKRI